MRRAAALPALALALAAGLGLITACGGQPAGQPPPPNAAATVELQNIAFNPKTVTVHAGQTVAWKFDDGTIPHNVTGTGFRSPDQSSGYYTHTFTTPGTYAYVCTIHSNMTGQVVVGP